MMNTSQNNATDTTSKLSLSSRYMRNLTLVTLFFIAVSLVLAMMYFLVWQHEEITEDAYVAGHSVQITPQIAGSVRKIMADDTGIVKKGDVLVLLDDSDFQLAYDRAQNELIQAIRKNKQQAAVSTQTKAQVLLHKADLAKAQADLRRRESLAGTDAISGEELSHARAAVIQAQAALKAMEAEEASAQAMLGKNVPLRQQPAVQTAISHIKDAWLNLQRTQIRAPIAGQIAKRNIQVGQRVEPGVAVMLVVPLQNLWVDANFKETQLRKMRIGQPVEMTADLYGSRVTYHGKVIGLSVGSGSVFSSNGKAESADMVQYVPVRISLDARELKANPLRVGLSMTAKVDTANSGDGKVVSEGMGKKTDMPEADVTDWSSADALIEQIFERYAK